jgi:glucokinase
MKDVRLLVDLGGTHTRCALQSPGKPPEHLRSTRNAEFQDLASVLRTYLDDLPGDQRPSSAALAVAAPVSGDRIDMTNLGWSFSAETLRRELGLEILRVVNDFTAVAMALPFLEDNDLLRVGGGSPQAGKAMAVLGPGTGLGVSGVLPVPGGWVALSGEGGHVTLAATDDREATVISLIRQQQGHVSAERLLSGFGLSNLYMALRSLSGEPGERLRPEEVSARADAGDRIAQDALGHFFAFLGSTAGNLALTLGALGGVFVAGGIIPRLRGAFVASRFRERFEGKGRYRDYMSRIPSYLITEKVPAFRGLAAILDGQMINLGPDSGPKEP